MKKQTKRIDFATRMITVSDLAYKMGITKKKFEIDENSMIDEKNITGIHFKGQPMRELFTREAKRSTKE